MARSCAPLRSQPTSRIYRWKRANNPSPTSCAAAPTLSSTGDIGLFLIISEGSAAAGIRRIEAVTGRGAYELVQRRFTALKQIAARLAATPEETPAKIGSVLDELGEAHKQIAKLRRELVAHEFTRSLEAVPRVAGIPVLVARLPNADADTLREMSDRFRQRYPSGVAVLASVGSDGRPQLVAAVTEDLVRARAARRRSG